MPFRRNADALGGSHDQLGHVLIIVLANDTTASQTLRLGGIALRLKQTIRRDLFRMRRACASMRSEDAA